MQQRLHRHEHHPRHDRAQHSPAAALRRLTHQGNPARRRPERKRFYVLFWSRDPDGSQHNQGDSLNSLTPGINGPTALAAAKNADNNLVQIVAYVQSNPALPNNTDIILTADHGFSIISEHEIDASGTAFVSDYASTITYKESTGRQEVNSGFLPVGFLALDLAHEFGLPLFDPDTVVTANGVRSYAPVDPTIPQALPTLLQHPVSGGGLIGGTGAILNSTDARIVVAANGGSDLIYVPSHAAASRSPTPPCRKARECTACSAAPTPSTTSPPWVPTSRPAMSTPFP